MPMAARDDEEMVPLSVVVKWAAIASVLVGLMMAVILSRWTVLFSVSAAPVTLYVLQRRGKF